MMLTMQVPFLKPKDLDHAARELLAKYSDWKGAPVTPPINVEEMTESFLELDFAFTDLRGLLKLPDVLGATWFDLKRVRVDSSIETQEGRVSFTIAHEIAHWTLHRPLYEMSKVTLPLFPSEPGSASSPAVVCRSGERKAPAEWQADAFAARILMPANSMRAAAIALLGEHPPEWEGLRRALDAGKVDHRLRDLARSMIADGFSNVSNEAMRIRIVELGLVQDAAEVSGRLF